MKELTENVDVPTKLASLRWINMLLEQRRREMNAFIKDLLPVLLHNDCVYQRFAYGSTS